MSIGLTLEDLKFVDPIQETGFTDLHCHVLPGVDDGASNLAEAKAAIERMQAAGVQRLVVTPHVNASDLLRGSTVERLGRELEQAWSGLTRLAASDFPRLRLHRGTELMLDHPHPDLSLDWVRLGGTRFVLVELPGMSIPPRLTEALTGLIADGYVPVVAHPERYVNARLDGAEPMEWRATGARLQVNVRSLQGAYGEAARRRARALLEHGAADYLASDYHCRGTYSLQECRSLLESDGVSRLEVLLGTNPARLLQGEDPLPVPRLEPEERRGWFRFLRGSGG